MDRWVDEHEGTITVLIPHPKGGIYVLNVLKKLYDVNLLAAVTQTITVGNSTVTLPEGSYIRYEGP